MATSESKNVIKIEEKDYSIEIDANGRDAKTGIEYTFIGIRGHGNIYSCEVTAGDTLEHALRGNENLPYSIGFRDGGRKLAVVISPILLKSNQTYILCDNHVDSDNE